MNYRIADYRRIEDAIRYLDEYRLEQPSLATVAAHVGMSEYHFQRLFRRFAGVSPKRFLQFVTAEHAKRLLRAGSPVLDAVWESGLSGPGRLHDLLIGMEAMTPGEYRREGAGLTIRHGFHSTPFGEALVATTERGICGLAFVTEGGRESALDGLRSRWPLSWFVADREATSDVVERIFTRETGPGPVHLHVRGTNFQIRVWQALLCLPSGTATTYGRLAAAIGAPGAARAVGGAVARNPVAFLIPCHRVLRQTGAFGDYRWGPLRKRVMLARESAGNGQGAGPVPMMVTHGNAPDRG